MEGFFVDPLDLNSIEPALAHRLRPAVTRLGYLGELTGVLAREPDILGANLDLAAAIRNRLEQTALEVLVLSVSSLTGNRYEQYQHEQLCAGRGYDDAWIAECVHPSRDHVGPVDQLTMTQRVLRNLAFDVIHDFGHGSSTVVRQAEAALGAQTTVAALCAIGYYINVSVIANALDVRAPVPPYLPSVSGQS